MSRISRLASVYYFWLIFHCSGSLATQHCTSVEGYSPTWIAFLPPPSRPIAINILTVFKAVSLLSLPMPFVSLYHLLIISTYFGSQYWLQNVIPWDLKLPIPFWFPLLEITIELEWHSVWALVYLKAAQVKCKMQVRLRTIARVSQQRWKNHTY